MEKSPRLIGHRSSIRFRNLIDFADLQGLDRERLLAENACADCCNDDYYVMLWSFWIQASRNESLCTRLPHCITTISKTLPTHECLFYPVSRYNHTFPSSYVASPGPEALFNRSYRIRISLMPKVTFSTLAMSG